MKKLIRELQSASRWTRLVVIFVIIYLIAAVDYFTGFEYSFFIFYLIPISLTVWVLDFSVAILLIVLSVFITLYVDLHLGCPTERLIVFRWNGWTTIFMFFFSSYLLNQLKEIFGSLEITIKKRTEAFEKEAFEKARLQEEILEVGDEEQRRIACDLHDVVCQYLTGIAYKVKALEGELKELQLSQALDAGRISQRVIEAIDLTRNCAEGLFPLEALSENLIDLLQKIVEDTNGEKKVHCQLEAMEGFSIPQSFLILQLYRIAREAVRNVVKYANAKNVVIRLNAWDGWIRLEIEDDGSGISEKSLKSGMGLRIMQYRAAKIGAVLQVMRLSPTGTLVTCIWREKDDQKI
ncbi:MAG: ATP-binding protein [Verrucomicrobiota bacterium]